MSPFGTSRRFASVQRFDWTFHRAGRGTVGQQRSKDLSLAAVVDDRRDDRVTVARNIAVLNLTPKAHESHSGFFAASKSLSEPLHVIRWGEQASSNVLRIGKPAEPASNKTP